MGKYHPMPDQLQAPLGLDLDAVHAIAQRAFLADDPDSLEQAHKYLYAIYAERIWRNPFTRISPSLERARAILEAGFRAQLERRRRDAGIKLDPPKQAELATWFESLVTGENPFDDETWGGYLRERASLDAMKSVVKQRSLFFLREPDPWIHAVPTIAGHAKAGLIDLLLDEYGWGKFDHMHSTVYARVMTALDLDATLDNYETTTSWQYLATLNHQWMCALDSSLSRRLIGTIYLTEADSPPAMTNYLAAWERLGIDDPNVLDFYELHVHADENHRDVALSEVAVPLAVGEGRESAREIATGIFDGRALEAEFGRSEMSASAEPLGAA
jgi:hypothetical protein